MSLVQPEDATLVATKIVKLQRGYGSHECIGTNGPVTDQSGEMGSLSTGHQHEDAVLVFTVQNHDSPTVLIEQERGLTVPDVCEYA